MLTYQSFHRFPKSVTPAIKMMAMSEHGLSSNNATVVSIINGFSCQPYFMPLIWSPRLICLTNRKPGMP